MVGLWSFSYSIRVLLFFYWPFPCPCVFSVDTNIDMHNIGKI
jgi:hypothetical protein